MKWAAAAFEAAYAAMLIRGTPAALDATVTIEPVPRAAIAAPAARLSRNTPVALTSKTSCHWRSVVSKAPPTCSTPATLTSTPIGPCRSWISRTARSTAAVSRTSSSRAGHPFSAATGPSAAPLRSLATTRRPSRRNARTTAAPMP